MLVDSIVIDVFERRLHATPGAVQMATFLQKVVSRTVIATRSVLLLPQDFCTPVFNIAASHGLVCTWTPWLGQNISDLAFSA